MVPLRGLTKKGKSLVENHFKGLANLRRATQSASFEHPTPEILGAFVAATQALGKLIADAKPYSLETDNNSWNSLSSSITLPTGSHFLLVLAVILVPVAALTSLLMRNMAIIRMADCVLVRWEYNILVELSTVCGVSHTIRLHGPYDNNPDCEGSDCFRNLTNLLS